MTDAPVEIVAYDSAWPARFEVERLVLEGALQPWLEGGIHHVGSTAVPGLAAKPIIDIMAGVRNFDEASAAIPLLEREHGYCYWLYRGLHWFCKPSPALRLFHLYLLEPSHPEWRARLAFRDFLRAHPTSAADYARLKVSLAAQFRTDREAYTAAKTDLVRSTTERALREGFGPCP
jgi:GrpB-like predicted nucleotidyltransferase (UPF0157 family)